MRSGRTVGSGGVAALLLCAGAVLAPPTPAARTGAAAPAAPVPRAHAADVSQAHDRHESAVTLHSRAEDIEEWLRVWDDPQPDAWTEPEHVVEKLRVQAGMRLVLLGAGTGYLDAWLARALGPAGVLYAVDDDSAMVRLIRARAQRDATPTVRPLLARNFDVRLPAASIDRLLLVDTYHHLNHRPEVLQRWRALLRPDGLAVIVEWRPGDLARGPTAAYKIAPEQVTDELRAAGFRLVERTALRYHDVLVFRAATPVSRP